MARLISGERTKENRKPIVLATQSIAQYEWMNNLSLRDVDEMLDAKGVALIKMGVGKSTIPTTGSIARHLTLEFADKIVAFPFSRGLSTEAEVAEPDPKELFDCVFRINNRTETDTEGVKSYTGEKYISFGKVSGIDIEIDVFASADVEVGG